MTKLQKEYYTDLEQDLFAYLEGADEMVSADTVLAKLNKVNQVTSGFLITDSGATVRLEGGTPKIQIAEDILQETEKLIIYVFYKESMALLLEKLSDYNPVYIRGGMKPGEVEEQKNLFNNVRKHRVIICQIGTTKFGHTLVGSDEGGRCFTSYYFNNSFSLDDRRQTEDRTDREGQVHGSIYVDPYGSPIELMMAAAVIRKQDMASFVIDRIKQEGSLVDPSILGVVG